MPKFINQKNKSNVRDIKNFITFATTHHLASYEWWRCGPIIWPPLFTACHMTSCDNSYEIFCVPSIILKAVNFSS